MMVAVVVMMLEMIIMTVFSHDFCAFIADGQFPINTESVHNDHDFLDTDSLQALNR